MKKLLLLLLAILFLNTCGGGGSSDSTAGGGGVVVVPAPEAPSNLTAIETGGGSIELSWTDNSTNESGFNIERKINSSGTFELLAAVIKDTTQYTDITAAESGSNYYYRIQAVNTGGSSGYSAEVSPVPKSPSSLSANTLVAGQINLTWNDNSYYETGYKIERKAGSGEFAYLTTLSAGATSYNNTGLTSGTLYTYRVYALNSSGNSGFSNEVSKYPDLTPGSPGSLTLTVPVINQIKLDWSDNSDNESGFKIERKDGDGGTWSQITTAGSNITTFTDTGLNSVTRYFYRVKAYNSEGDSVYSNEPSYYAVPLPPVPAGLILTVPRDGEIQLNWTDASVYETGFKIERSINSTSSWSQITATSANVTTYTDSGLRGSNYYYRLRATGINGDSSYSSYESKYPLTLPLSPSGISASLSSYWEDLGDFEYNLILKYSVSWTDNSLNESAYYIRVIDVSAGDYFWMSGLPFALSVNAQTAEKIYDYYSLSLYDIDGLNDEHDSIRIEVYAYNIAGESGLISTTKVIPMTPPWIMYDAYIPASAAIVIGIRDCSIFENRYLVERSPDGSSGWTEIGTVSTTLGSKSSVVNYTDTFLTPGVTYYYRVRGYNTVTGELSIYSPIISAQF